MGKIVDPKIVLRLLVRSTIIQRQSISGHSNDHDYSWPLGAFIKDICKFFGIFDPPFQIDSTKRTTISLTVSAFGQLPLPFARTSLMNGLLKVPSIKDIRS